MTLTNSTHAGVIAELEKLGPKYRIALRIAKDERWERLECGHKGVYADDCIVERVMKHKVYIVATNDRDLKRRVRKVPGVPIMSVGRGTFFPFHFFKARWG
jgi:U3 small nucleolar RNA-associated protein 24